MINYFAGIWKRLRLKPERRRTSEDSQIVISSDARVSLESNGAVFLHAHSGIVFTSNRIGARIWQGLLDRESVDTIAASICEADDVCQDQVRQDTADFVAELETQGFLSRRIGC
jgi:hypothetical protein